MAIGVALAAQLGLVERSKSFMQKFGTQYAAGCKKLIVGPALSSVLYFIHPNHPTLSSSENALQLQRETLRAH
jgi:hypothetical protein